MNPFKHPIFDNLPSTLMQMIKIFPTFFKKYFDSTKRRHLKPNFRAIKTRRKGNMLSPREPNSEKKTGKDF